MDESVFMKHLNRISILGTSLKLFLLFSVWINSLELGVEIGGNDFTWRLYQHLSLGCYHAYRQNMERAVVRSKYVDDLWF